MFPKSLNNEGTSCVALPPNLSFPEETFLLTRFRSARARELEREREREKELSQMRSMRTDIALSTTDRQLTSNVADGFAHNADRSEQPTDSL